MSSVHRKRWRCRRGEPSPSSETPRELSTKWYHGRRLVVLLKLARFVRMRVLRVQISMYVSRTEELTWSSSHWKRRWREAPRPRNSLSWRKVSRGQRVRGLSMMEKPRWCSPSSARMLHQFEARGTLAFKVLTPHTLTSPNRREERICLIRPLPMSWDLLQSIL